MGGEAWWVSGTHTFTLGKHGLRLAPSDELIRRAIHSLRTQGCATCLPTIVSRVSSSSRPSSFSLPSGFRPSQPVRIGGTRGEGGGRGGRARNHGLGCEKFNQLIVDHRYRSAGMDLTLAPGPEQGSKHKKSVESRNTESPRAWQCGQSGD